MFAVIYLAIGAVVGALVRNPVNGTVIDAVRLDPRRLLRPGHGRGGPARHPRAADPLRDPVDGRPALRGTAAGPATSAGRWPGPWPPSPWPGRSRRRAPAPPARRRRPRARVGRPASSAAAARPLARRPAQPGPVGAVRRRAGGVHLDRRRGHPGRADHCSRCAEHGQRLATSYAMPAVHGATMAPDRHRVAGRAGRPVRRRWTAAPATGAPPWPACAPASLLTARLGVLAVAALAATAVSLAATALVFDAARWPTYAAANVLLAIHLRPDRRPPRPALRPRRRGVHRVPPPLPRHRHRAEPDAAPRTHRPSHDCCPATAAPASSSTAPSPAASTKPAPADRPGLAERPHHRRCPDLPTHNQCSPRKKRTPRLRRAGGGRRPPSRSAANRWGRPGPAHTGIRSPDDGPAVTA